MKFNDKCYLYWNKYVHSTYLIYFDLLLVNHFTVNKNFPTYICIIQLIYIGLKLFTIYKFHKPWIYWFLFYLFHHFLVVFVVSPKLIFESKITFSFPVKNYLWDAVLLFSIVLKLDQGFSASLIFSYAWLQ